MILRCTLMPEKLWARVLFTDTQTLLWGQHGGQYAAQGQFSTSTAPRFTSVDNNSTDPFCVVLYILSNFQCPVQIFLLMVNTDNHKNKKCYWAFVC